MALRLKRLELQGFKSFATRTVFDVSLGLTAIVGPNGSGKSNLSEAVRWVLGEQSNLALRGRRGDDVIFAGSGGRAALGMAEVALTLDNSAGELPLEYNEVTIARRIFRDGETQYLINGGRVRLRDLLEPSLRAPGCLSFSVQRSQVDADLWLLTGSWCDERAMSGYFASPTLDVFGELLQERVVSSLDLHTFA